ncbi:MAG: hypothetical protein KDD50_14635, partial [Bdellovibrionales bacterium]|nr:hypothetical protein [Bdellovibrionales bacterium]
KYSIEIKNKYEFGAKIKFIPSPTQRSPLFEFLKARNTNRYFFSKANPDVIKKLTLPFENKALFVEKPSIQQLWTVSRLETSILRWPKVFFDLLDTIYLEDDVAPPREGLHWKNVELNILEKSIVHQVRRKPQWYPYLYWSIYWNMLLKNFFKYSLGNGFVVFPFKDFSNQSLVELGETATLFWIMAAQNNLSMQPLTLSSLFHNQVSVEQTPPELPSSVIKVFNNSSKLINESFYWAFRIGKGPLLKGPELTRRLHTSEILSR